MKTMKCELKKISNDCTTKHHYEYVYFTLVSSSIILALVNANVMLGFTKVVVIHLSTT